MSKKFTTVSNLVRARERTYSSRRSPVEEAYEKELRRQEVGGVMFQTCGGGRRIIRKKLGGI